MIKIYSVLNITKNFKHSIHINAIKIACTDLERVFGNVFFKRYIENMVNVY
jgi:hypothetical protein